MSISQAIPFPGKLALRSSMANTKAAQFSQSVAAAQLALVRQVKELYASWFSASRALELLNRKASTLQDARRYAEARYVVGQSPQEHLLKAELEIYYNQEIILHIEEKVQSTRIQLGSLLDVPEDSLVGAPREIPFTSFPCELGELQAWALRNPALVQARLMAREESLAVRLAKRDLMPNLMIQAGKEFKGPFKDMYEVMLGVEIPLYLSKKQMPLVQAAQLQLESSRHNLRSMEIEIETELRNNFVKAKYAEKRIALYRERILPQAELSLRASIFAYQANETDFVALLTDINDLFSHRIEYAGALAALWAAAARLEELTGKELLGANEGK
ncbi:MAG: TolC family protein [Candidatus Oleimicrobiaceae bacterium]